MLQDQNTSIKHPLPDRKSVTNDAPGVMEAGSSGAWSWRSRGSSSFNDTVVRQLLDRSRLVMLAAPGESRTFCVKTRKERVWNLGEIRLK